MILLTRKVYNQLNKDVQEAGNQYETGGLLLGYKLLGLYYIVAITASDEKDDTTNISFVLDGAKHKVYAAEIAKQFRVQPDMLGVWHSHTNEINHFSEQDKASHKQLVRSIGSSISMLVTMNGTTKELNLIASYITANAREYSCRVRKVQ